MSKEERIAITSLISGWYACQVYGNKPSDKYEALKKEDEAYRVLLSLEVKADKWDMIQWAIDNQIGFVALSGGSGIWIEKVDMDCLEQLYKECEQNE